MIFCEDDLCKDKTSCHFSKRSPHTPPGLHDLFMAFLDVLCLIASASLGVHRRCCKPLAGDAVHL